VIAVEDHEDGGRREVVRLATGLGEHLQPPIAEALAQAALDEQVLPTIVHVVVPQDTAHADEGVVAHVEGRQLALGRYNYIVQLGLVLGAVPRA
jgi:cation transport ATPase